MKFNISFEKILNSSTKIKILKAFFKVNSAMSERELSRLVKVSHMSINRFMKQLSDINLVNYQRIGESHVWKLNKDSLAYKELSKIIRGFSSAQPPLVHLKKIILRYLQVDGVIKIVLFGSVPNKNEKPNSDIDLFILTSGSQIIQKIKPALDKLTTLAFEYYGNRVSPYILTEKEFNAKIGSALISKIEKGIVIYQA